MNRLLASILVPRRSGAVVQRYGAATVSVALAAAAALLLRRYNLPHPFVSFSFAAIAITLWYAGPGPGLLAVVLSCSTWSCFLSPGKVGNLPWDSYLIFYGVFGLFASWFNSSRIRAERLLSEARDALEVRVAERTAELTTANQALKRAQEELEDLTHQLAQENLYLEDEIRSDANFKKSFGKSAELHRVLKLVETVAPTDSTALIYGETGTGKELIARAIHNLSSRRSRTFVRLNCAAIPTGLLESELFGHEKGAFTGASQSRRGRFEEAQGGTIFLDEIGDLAISLQSKLLRVLQEREFERLGSTRTLSTNVRLIAATNRDLGAMVEEGNFRSDLFFRLNVFPIDLPPVRERREDIPLLVRHFAEDFSRRMNKTIETISPATMDALERYSWPGNIRELQNVIERAVILSPGAALVVPVEEMDRHTTREPAPEVDPARSKRRRPVRSILADVDREQIIRALKETVGRVGGPEGAASRLGLKRTTFITRMKKLGINPNAVSARVDATNDTSDTSDTSDRSRVLLPSFDASLGKEVI